MGRPDVNRSPLFTSAWSVFKLLYNFRVEKGQKNKKMKESLLPMKKYLGFDLSTQSLKAFNWY